MNGVWRIAVAITGGMEASTVLTLIVIPAVYALVTEGRSGDGRNNSAKQLLGRKLVRQLLIPRDVVRMQQASLTPNVSQKGYHVTTVASGQQLDELGFLPMLQCSANRKSGQMTTRFIRLLIASFVLLSALFSGALADGLECGEAETSREIAGEWTTFSSHTSHQGATGADDSDRSDDLLHETLGCHSAGSGCLGCLLPFDVVSAAPIGYRVVYPLRHHIGRSIESADNFRPPIASL